MRLKFGVIVCFSALAGMLQAAGPKAEKGTANRLLKEKSPYLQLHAYNPVDWYPWGEAAFKKAKDEKKLILLSIGYSTCHWCHVMERESFEDEEIAKYLNENYVAIKLDREERPDVDQVYMTAFQAMTGGNGGWPLNMILTPDLKPLTGGTYFPPVDRGGLPGFGSVLKKVQGVWAENPEGIARQAGQSYDQLREYFEESLTLREDAGKLDDAVVVNAVPKILAQIDPEWGGVGQEMKFPQVNLFRFLLQSKDPKAVAAVLKTCRHMADGGIHDQVTGGFHRYAVDREWLVPHFEKMLYDQAQLLDLYLDAWQISGDEAFRKTAKGIADYVLKELVHPEGGFYCAQDAQSEGKEGKFACWTLAELEKILTTAEVKLSREILGVSAKGNFYDHSDPEALDGQNVLHFKKPSATLSDAESKAVATIFAKLAKERSERVPPATDDKILASWNGMMIGSLARAGLVLGEDGYLAAARKAHGFVKAKLWDSGDGKLYHRWREGERDQSLQAESYLLFLSGTRKLYEATLDEDYLSFAIELAEGALKNFYDEKNGGFFQGEKRPDLVLRLKGQFDGAIPTESSVAVREFAILAEMTGREEFRAIAGKTLKSYLPSMKEAPTGLSEMLSSFRFYLTKPPRLVLAGKEGREELLKVASGSYDPARITLGTEGPVSEFTAGLKPMDDKSTAYYCVGQSCQLPVNEAKALAALLKRMSEESK
ncbi:thioredoxin domain-containing protein [Verrucomicrobiaceae bacterium 227]